VRARAAGAGNEGPWHLASGHRIRSPARRAAHERRRLGRPPCPGAACLRSWRRGSWCWGRAGRRSRSLSAPVALQSEQASTASRPGTSEGRSSDCRGAGSSSGVAPARVRERLCWVPAWPAPVFPLRPRLARRSVVGGSGEGRCSFRVAEARDDL